MDGAESSNRLAAYPTHSIIGNRGYLAKLSSVADISHKKNTEPRAEFMRFPN
jgi:hypothetical protein